MHHRRPTLRHAHEYKCTCISSMMHHNTYRSVFDVSMASLEDNATGFSESDLHFARETFFRDCPNGYCSKEKFLTFIRKSATHTTLQKITRSNIFIQTLISRQNYRQSRKFFAMMFDIYDRNHDGKLDFNEYIYALSALTGANRLRTIETLYNFFDRNNQGYITRQEFNARKKLAAQFLGQYKTGIQDSLSYEQAFNTMDIDQDGRISRQEFIQWHLQDHLTIDGMKPVKKRTRLLKNLSTLVDIRGQIKTSSLQHTDQVNTRHPIDAWLDTATNGNAALEWVVRRAQRSISFDAVIRFCSMPPSPTSLNADRYLIKVLRRARNRFIQHRHSINNHSRGSQSASHDNQSDSGAFTSSSRTNFHEDLESNSLSDMDDNYEASIDFDDWDDEQLCQSVETVLMETLLELRQYRHQRSSIHQSNRSLRSEQHSIVTRLWSMNNEGCHCTRS